MSSTFAEDALHCVICVEQFNTTDRKPVVLPCGHTYVCEVCVQKIKRCMECREPLFWTPKPRIPPQTVNLNTRSPAPSRYSTMRGRYPPAPSTPPHASQGTPVKEEPIPLPLPKNVVLMEMIESVERQARLLEEAKNGAGESSTRLDPTLTTASAYSSCGTYRVKERSGLAVLPFDPNSQGNKKKQADEEKKAEEAREPLRVEEGQTVQVVSIDQGVYKLARGSGFIVATVNQLVRGMSAFSGFGKVTSSLLLRCTH